MKIYLNGILPNADDLLWKNVNRCKDSAATQSCTQNLGDFTQLILNIIQIALLLVGTIALLYFIYNAMLYLSSAGNPDRAGQGKNGMLYTVLGLLLIIFSYSIISFITGIW